MSSPLRIVLVDDHEMFRQGVALIMGRDDRLVVVGTGATSEQAVELVAAHEPDVLVLDVELHGVPARTTISLLRRQFPATRVVVLSMHRDSTLERELLRAGAQAYVTKSVPAERLLEAIRTAVSTEADPPVSDGKIQLLSDREQRVLSLMAEAKSNRRIAEELQIAEGTVKRHASNIFQKLEAASRMDAVEKARRLGIIV